MWRRHNPGGPAPRTPARRGARKLYETNVALKTAGLLIVRELFAGARKVARRRHRTRAHVVALYPMRFRKERTSTRRLDCVLGWRSGKSAAVLELYPRF